MPSVEPLESGAHNDDAGFLQMVPRRFDELFSEFDRIFRTPFSSWARIAVAPQHKPNVAFYPFGGPDFCFVNALFPDADEYILVGREACLSANIGNYRSDMSLVLTSSAFKHYLARSYFITKALVAEIEQSDIGCILPLLVAQVELSGFEVMSVSLIGDDPQTGVKINFRDLFRCRQLYVYNQDLRDNFLGEVTPLWLHLRKHGSFATFIKSASYLLHEPNFARLRDWIRAHASVVVQDPSGVPLTLLQSWGWSIEHHGHFTADILDFKQYDQSALASAYQTTPLPGPLNFGLGYLTDPSSSAIMIAAPPPLVGQPALPL